MSEKLNVGRIISGHVRTLHVFGSTRISYFDVLSFYFVPLGCSVLIVFSLGKQLTPSAISLLATIFSIFVGLLLNLLVLVFDLVRKKALEDEHRTALLKEAFSNISYAVLLSVILLVVLLLSRLVPPTFLSLFSFLAFTLAGNFLLTLLMVLKRVHTLLSAEADSQTRAQ